MEKETLFQDQPSLVMETTKSSTINAAMPKLFALEYLNEIFDNCYKYMLLVQDIFATFSTVR